MEYFEHGYYVEDAAKKLKVSEQSIRGMIRTKKIKANKIGRRYYIPNSEINKLILSDSDNSSNDDKYKAYIEKIRLLEEENRDYKRTITLIQSYLQQVEN